MVSGKVDWTYSNAGMSNSACVRNYTRSYSKAVNRLVTPTITVTEATMLTFDYKVADVAAWLKIYVSYDGGITFGAQPLAELQGSANPVWMSAIPVAIPAPASGGNGITVAFEAYYDREQSSSSTFMELYLDNVVIERQPACATPIGVRMVGCTASSVELAWDFVEMGSPGPVAQMDIKNAVTGEAVEGASILNQSEGRMTIGGLEVATKYAVRVKSDCSEDMKGTSAWSEEFVFSTLCNPRDLTQPMQFSFDNDTELPSCWVVSRTDGDAAGVALSATVEHGEMGGKSLEISKNNGAGTGSTYIFTEPIAHQANALEVSMYLYNANSTEKKFEIGVQTNIYEPATYVPVKEITMPSGKWKYIALNTDEMDANVNASVVFWAKDMTDASVFVDDIKIQKMPACPVPEDVRITASGDNWIELDWKHSDDASTMLVVYNVQDDPNGTFVKTLKSTDNKLPLEPDKVYTLKFKAFKQPMQYSAFGCDEIVYETSSECGSIAPEELNVNFDDRKIPECWKNDGVDGLVWSVPSTVLTYPKGTAGVKVPLILQAISIDPADQGKYQFCFDMYRTITGAYGQDHRVNVYAATSPSVEGATLLGSVPYKAQLEPVFSGSGFDKRKYTIPLTGTVYIILEAELDNGNTSIDNIYVKRMSDCPMPTELAVGNVTENSATVVWASNADQTPARYVVTYTLNSETKTEIITDGSNRCVITGLETGKSYKDFKVTVQAECNGGDLSDPAEASFSFKTPCGAKPLPYDIADDADVSSSDWACYTVLRTFSTMFGSYPKVQSIWDKKLQFEGKSGEEGNAIALPKLESADSYRLNFTYQTYDNGKLTIGTVDDVNNWENMTVATVIQAVGDMYVGSEAKDYSIVIENVAGRYIIIKYEGVNGSNYSDMSNLRVEVGPDCPDITDVKVLETTVNSANIRVTCSKADRFKVEYGVAGFARGSEDGTVKEVGTDFTISDLADNTEYDFYVWSLCDNGGGEGVPFEIRSFKTKCNPAPVDAELGFSEGFESSSDLGCWISVGDTKWRVVSSEFYAFKSKRYACLDASGVNKQSDLYYAVDMKAGETYEFTCYARLNAAADGYSISAGYCDAFESGNVNYFIDHEAVTNANEYVKYACVFTPSADSKYLIIRGETSGYSNALRLDSVSITPFRCPFPTNITVTDVADTKVTIGWQQEFVDNYRIRVTTREFDDPETAEGTELVFAKDDVPTVDSEIEIDGLAPNTRYYAYMQSVCTANSRWTDAVRFRTFCTTEAGDFSEDFEDEDTSLPCWRWNEGDVLEVLNGGYESTRMCRIKKSGEQSSSVVALPAVDGDLSDMVLHMYAQAAEFGKPVEMVIGVTKLPLLPITPTRITTVTLTKEGGWVEVYCYFNKIKNTDMADARYVTISADAMCNIDAVTISAVSACARPIALTVSEVTANSAEMDWSMYEEKPCSVVVKNGGTVVKSLVAENHPFTIEGLMDDTEYTVEVTTVCDGSESEAGTVSFRTICGLKAFPYRNDFEEVADLPACWSDTAKVYAGAIDPKYNLWVPKSDVLPGNTVMGYEENYGAKGSTSILQTPAIDLTGVTEAVLYFSAYSIGGVNNEFAKMSVLISEDGGETFADTILENVSYSDKWTKVEYDLTKYLGKHIAVGFMGIKTSIYGAWMYIDNVRVDKKKVCYVPAELTVSDIAAHTATVSWTSQATEFVYRLYRGETLVTEETTTRKSVHLTNLDAITGYTIKVSSYCDNGDESDEAVMPFRTECGSEIEIPYVVDFDGFADLPECWVEESVSAAKWSISQEPGGNGVVRFDSHNGNAGDRARLFSSDMKIDETGYRLSIDYLNPDGGPLTIMITADGGITYADTLVSKAQNIGVWQSVSMSLDKYKGQTINMVAEGISNISLAARPYIMLDNFRVSRVSDDVKTFRDTVCYGQPYMENGFEIAKVKAYGENRVQRMALAADSADPDTLYEAVLFVPQTDYFYKDVIVKGRPYVGKYPGFEGVTEPGHKVKEDISTVTGCDSITHLELTEILLEVVVFDTVCEANLPYIFCGEELIESCSKVCVSKNAYDMDSTTTLHLTVLPAVVEREITICEGDYVEFDGQKLMQTGVYEADSTYRTTKGCAYIARLNLTVIDSVTVKEETICEGSYVEIDGRRYSEAGSYRIVLNPEKGCKRVMKLELTVTPAEVVTYADDACEDKPIYFPGFAGTMVKADTVMYRTSKRSGCDCDSITRLEVTFHKSVEGYDTVYCTENTYTCENGDVLTATGTCDYVVETEFGCDSIHHRRVVFNSDVKNLTVNNLVITPNPVALSMPASVDGEWTDAMMDGMTVEVLDVTGRVLYRSTPTGRPVVISGIGANGIYVVRITDGNGKLYMGKLVVE